MVASTGSQYVILGHSERRSYYGETDEILVKKVARALENKLEVIFCVGEVLAERESEKHFDVVKSQLVNGLFNLSAEEFSHIIIAYEPVWAIGTGKTATSAQAQEMHAFIRKVVAENMAKKLPTIPPSFTEEVATLKMPMNFSPMKTLMADLSEEHP